MFYKEIFIKIEIYSRYYLINSVYILGILTDNKGNQTIMNIKNFTTNIILTSIIKVLKL